MECALNSIIGNSKIEIHSIVPPQGCPGHYDLTLKEMDNILKAKALFYFDYERFIYKDFKEKGYTINSYDSSLIPDNYIKILKQIFNELRILYPEKIGEFENNLINEEKNVMAIDEKLKKERKYFKGKKILVSKNQAAFCKYLGFKIINTFKREEEFSLKDWDKIMENKYELVVGNLQEGLAIYNAICKKLNLPCVVLSNFPEKSYEELILKNLEILKKGMDKNDLL